jgi:hypothetical protein
VFRRKRPAIQPVDEDRHADLIDLLLAADEPTRQQIMAQIVESGTLTRPEGDDVMARVVRLERLASPRGVPPTPPSGPKPAWGIDHP